MAHTVEIKEIINGVQITETLDADIVVKLISYQSKPFLRTTNESSEETYQVLDIVGEVYNTPAIATDFRIIDANDNVFIPANGVELIEYSLKIRAFRPDADVNEVLAVGPITTTSNSVTLGLHAGGTNAVRIDGLTYEKYYPDLFNFTPVTTGEKILIIHALPDAQVFHLAQGAESTEAVEPAYSGLFVARLLVTTEGIDIVEATSGFREKAVDNFAIYSLAAGDRVIGVGANMRLKVQSAGAIRIGGFYNEEDKLYNGCPISVRNDTPFPMEFYNAVDTSPEFIAINSADLPFSIKPGETANFAYRGGGIVEIIKTGGSASFPETGSNADVLVKDSAVDGGVKWSNRLTNAETGKLDKPTTDGNWVITITGGVVSFTSASTFGQNIANTNLSNASARIFTQGNTFVWDANGFKYSIKNLVNSVNIASVLVRNSAQEVESATVVELVVENGTTALITAVNLDTTYPLAVLGFEVVCPNISTASYPTGLIYKKFSTGWKAIKLDNV